MEISKKFRPYMTDIVRSLPATLFFKDTKGKYVFTTKTCDLINAGPDGTIIGKWDYDVQFDKELGRRYYEEDMQILKTGKPTHCIDRFFDPDGNECYIEILKEAIRNDDGEIIGICGICNDVTELEKLRRQYQKMSLYDPMTGAYNRNYVVEYDFDNAESLPCSYIFCDCNNLKKINDSYGHDMGDRYILETFKILKNATEEHSIIVRWGGDEFLVITPSCERTVHDRILEKIQTFQAELSDIKPEMGIAAGGMVRETLEIPESAVMKQADQNMYENKKKFKVSP